MSIHVIILAAGQGKRMMSDLPKVAHPAAGRSLLEWVLNAIRPLNAVSTVVVVGDRASAVEALLPEGVTVALQSEQLGTGHAAQVGLEAIPGMADDDTVLLLYGDMPLLTSDLLASLVARGESFSTRLVSAEFEDPTGYGRVIRNASGAVVEIVEEADCTPEQSQIREINAGVYAFRADELAQALAEISPHNAQEEFYLTDVIGILVGRGARVEPVAASPEEVVGINSQDQLAEATRLLQRRTVQRFLDSGVWILDPDRTYIDDTVSIEPGARIYPGVHLEGDTSVGARSRIGPDTFVVDSSIGDDSTVWYSVLRGAVVGEGCEVGPYASLRPGTVLFAGAKVGTFVETKNTTLGEDTKVPHLSYLGDAKVGARSNIGAGTITCNYDGVTKSTTEIGDDVFIGSDTMLVAPIKISDRASTGAGSVITTDVSEGALAIERSVQKEIPGYADRREAERVAKKESEG